MGYDANNDGDTFDAGDYRYAYDGLGRRLTKFQDTASEGSNAAGTTEEYYQNEADQVLEVRTTTVSGGNKTPAAGPRERYLWDLTYVDAPAMIELDTNTDGTRDQQLWPTFDANYNVTGLLSDQGVTVERYAYTPYGERIILNGDQNYANTGADADGAEWTVDTNGSDYGNVVGFQGLRQDPETGAWQADDRSLGSAQGTWFKRDATGYADGMSLYQAMGGNPVTRVDPSGDDSLSVPRPPPQAKPNGAVRYCFTLECQHETSSWWVLLKLYGPDSYPESLGTTCVTVCPDDPQAAKKLGLLRPKLNGLAFDLRNAEAFDELADSDAAAIQVMIQAAIAAAGAMEFGGAGVTGERAAAEGGAAI